MYVLGYFWDLGNGYTLASFCFFACVCIWGGEESEYVGGCCIGIVMGIEWKGRIKHMIWVLYYCERQKGGYEQGEGVYGLTREGVPLLWSCSDICSLARAKGGRSWVLLLQRREGRKERGCISATEERERETAFCIHPLAFIYIPDAGFSLESPFSVWNANHHVDVRELGARHTLKRFPSLRLTDDWSCCKDIRFWITSYNPIFWDLKE